MSYLKDGATKAYVDSAVVEGAAQKTKFNVKDYGAVGNGIANDGTAIAAAITAANSAGGGIVFLPTGTYLVTAAVTVSGNNITLQGAGRSATIIKTVGDHIIIQGTSASGLVVRDLQVLGDADAAKISQRGVQWNGVTDGLIDNVWAKNLGYDGILLLAGNVNCTVSNCRVSGCQDDGINIGGDNATDTTGTVVVGNVISDGLHTGIHISDRSRFTTVTGNTITGCDTGIDTYTSDVAWRDQSNTITGNAISGCATNGIRIFASLGNTITANTVEGGAYGVRIEGGDRCIVTGNVIKDTTSYGFRVQSSGDVVVSSNLFVGATAGVGIESPRVHFTGNNMRNVTAPVFLNSAADYSVINDNIITGATGHNIEIQAQDCVVNGNNLSDGNYSIYGNNSTRAVVSGNRVTGSARGIVAGGADMLVTGNVISAQTQISIYAAAQPRVQIIGNRIFDSASGAINAFNAVEAYIADNYTTNTTGNSLTADAGSTGMIIANNRFDSSVAAAASDEVQITLTPTTTYAPTNVSTDRAFDADATTVEELADVLGTLIADLKTKGIIAT